MEYSPDSKATTITEFIEKLATDDGLLLNWVKSRGEAIKSQALSDPDQELLLSGDFGKIREKVKPPPPADAEAAARWLVIWIV